MLIGSSGPCGQAILENTDPTTHKTGLSPNAEIREWNPEDLKLLTGSLLDYSGDLRSSGRWACIPPHSGLGSVPRESCEHGKHSGHQYHLNPYEEGCGYPLDLWQSGMHDWLWK